MKHHRHPTHNYTHATLALPHVAIPTLLSPLRSSALDDFQSNACCPPPLAGLGIYPLFQQDSPLRMHVDHDGSLTESPPDETTIPYFTLNGLCDEHIRLGLDNDIDPATNDIIGLIPDVNMYDRFRRRDPPHTGVNPLDTICNTSLHDIGISYGEPISLSQKDHESNHVPSARPEQSPSPRVIQDIMSILVQPPPDVSFLPWTSAESPSVPRMCTSIKLEPPHDSKPQLVSAPSNFECSNTSPVLNAHLGIELDDLISRAERFRTKFPERNIDRTWLSHFAGKLSDRGELLDDFRCYVIGCDQRNKRRDHILVHVGAHVGQRPFACSVCPLRFLRKNECKRHEASHSGFRPYNCDICGQSFVRQDLVKRHMKRTHGLKGENQARQPRKKARLELVGAQ